MLSVIVLVAAILCQPSSSRHLVQTVHEKLSEVDKEDPYIKDEIHDMLESLRQMWTELIDESFSSPNISQGCLNSTRSVLTHSVELPVFKTAVPELLPMLDATGRLGPGFFRGNHFIGGSFDECLGLNYASFCSARAKISPQLVFTLQLCVPRHCSEQDIRYLITTFTPLEMGEEDMLCTDTKSPSYSVGTVIMLITCSVFAVLVIAGTFIDYARNCKGHVTINNDGALSRNFSASEKFPLLTTTSQIEVKRKCKVLPLDFVLAFSLIKTVPALLATKQSPSVITSLNGIRVISMFWIILGHTYAWPFTVGILDNTLDLLIASGRFSFQAIDNAFFSVDSFFFLSGTLVAYLTLCETKKRNGRFPVLHYYIHRYLRLTPTYCFVLFFAWFLIQHLTNSSLSMGSPYISPQCSKYWWTNLLYINNFYPWKMEDECIGWSWYLANDMQFYIIAPLILVPAYFLFPLGLGIALAMLLAGFIVTASLAGVYDLQANMLAPFAYGYSNPNNTHAFLDVIYVKPWARISPYLVGLILGYILYRGIKIPFNRMVRSVFYLAMWIVSGAIFVGFVYGSFFSWHGHVPTKSENVIYITFGRFAWGIGLALLVFACHNGYGGYINSFLSMPIWVPLSRMTYNTYLLHPIVLTVIFGEFQAVHYSDITMFLLEIGIIVLSYGAAAFVCVCVEFPLGTIETLIFKLVGLQGRKTQ